MDKGRLVLAAVLLLALATWLTVDRRGQHDENGPSLPGSRPGPMSDVFLQEQGVLYVRSEAHQDRLGLSIVRGGGEFGPLTTVYEWWIDAQNPWRFRNEAHEILDSRAHLSGAMGSDGSRGWWRFEVIDGTGSLTRHAGRAPLLYGAPEGRSTLTFADQVQQIGSGGPTLLAALQRGEAEELGTEPRLPFGTVIRLRHHDSRTRKTTTATVRAEPPHTVLEASVVDDRGQAFSSRRITDWRWLAVEELGDDFWLTPPPEVSERSSAMDP